MWSQNNEGSKSFLPQVYIVNFMLYQAMSALDEKTKAERALKDLQKTQGEQQVLFHID